MISEIVNVSLLKYFPTACHLIRLLLFDVCQDMVEYRKNSAWVYACIWVWGYF